jgi:hypothetical protein
VHEIETWLGQCLPEVYREVLASHGGQTFASSVQLYAPEHVVERNEVYETKIYCPGFITIGDDGGGQAVVVPVKSDACPVSVVGHGLMDPDYFREIAASLAEWVSQECPIE